MTADWGGDDRQLRDVWPSEALPAERLPAVTAARAAGWFLAPDAPVWAFLPAVWPAAARAWVPDRSVRMSGLRCDGGAEVAIPWSAWDHREHERDLDDLLLSAGVPARPFGRLWLLRPPPHLADLDTAVDRLTADAGAAGLALVCTPELVRWTDAAVRRWFAGAP